MAGTIYTCRYSKLSRTVLASLSLVMGNCIHPRAQAYASFTIFACRTANASGRIVTRFGTKLGRHIDTGQCIIARLHHHIGRHAKYGILHKLQHNVWGLHRAHMDRMKVLRCRHNAFHREGVILNRSGHKHLTRTWVLAMFKIGRRHGIAYLYELRKHGTNSSSVTVAI